MNILKVPSNVFRWKTEQQTGPKNELPHYIKTKKQDKLKIR